MDNLLVPGRELGKLLGLTDELHPIDSVDTSARGAKIGEDRDLLPVISTAGVR
jgi:hypothetical protein